MNTLDEWMNEIKSPYFHVYAVFGVLVVLCTLTFYLLLGNQAEAILKVNIVMALLTLFIAIANVVVAIIAYRAYRYVTRDKVVDEAKELLKELSLVEHRIKLIYQKYNFKLMMLHNAALQQEFVRERYCMLYRIKKYRSIRLLPKNTFDSEVLKVKDGMADFQESYKRSLSNFTVLQEVVDKEQEALKKAFSLFSEVLDIVYSDFKLFESIFNNVGTEVGVFEILRRKKNKKKYEVEGYEFEAYEYEYTRLSHHDFLPPGDETFQMDNDLNRKLCRVLDVSLSFREGFDSIELELIDRLRSSVSEFDKTKSIVNQFSDMKLSNDRLLGRCFSSIRADIRNVVFK